MRRALPLLLLLLAILGVLAWFVLRDTAVAPSVAPARSTSIVPEDVAAAPDEVRTRQRVDVAETASDVRDLEADETADVPQSFVLRVVAREGGRGIHGLAVRVGRDPRRSRVTDEDGRVAIEPLAGELTLDVETDAPGAGSVTLTHGETRIEVPDPVPLTVHFVSQETGDWTQGSAFFLSDEKPRAEHSLSNVALWPGQRYDLQLDGTPLEPFFVAPQPSALKRTGTLSRYAKAAEITIALPHRTAATIRVSDPRGAPVEGVHVSIHHDTGVWLKETTGEDGTARVDRLPFYRRATLTAYADLDGRDAAPETALQEDLTVEPVIDLVLPDEPEVGSGFGIGRGSHSSRTVSRRRENLTGTAVIVLRVLRRDGRPAGDAQVSLSGPWAGSTRTDAGGVARFEGLPGGTYAARVDEHGLAAMAQTIELGEGETLQVVLEEPSGRRVHVRVVDAAGRGVPLARLAVRSEGEREWVPITRDVQSLDVHTDRRGEAWLEAVPPGAVRVTATYGGRTGQGTVDEDGSATVTIPD